MKKLCCLLLALLLLVLPFASCKKEEGVTVVSGGALTIAYDKNLLTLREAQDYQKQIEAATSLKVTLTVSVTDETNVIFGDIDCAPCHLANDTLRNKDWTAGVYGGKYVVGARGADAFKKAVAYFIETVLPQVKDGKLIAKEADNHAEISTYKVETISIGGTPLGRTAIVVPSDYTAAEYRTAVLLGAHILKTTGYLTDLCVGAALKAATTQIRIGRSLCSDVTLANTNDYEIKGNGTALEVVADTPYGYQAASEALERVFSARNNALDITADTVWTGSGDGKVTADATRAGDVRIMVNNVYTGASFYDGEGYDFNQRMQMATEVYAYYMPDVLGLQEVGNAVRSAISPKLAALGYKEVSKGRSPASSGNNTPLYYLPETVEELNSGYLWYNQVDYLNAEYTDLCNGFTAAQVKSLNMDESKGITWGIFRVKATGEVFLAASTHLMWARNSRAKNPDDPYGAEINEAARRMQVCALKEALVNAANKWLTENGREVGTMPMFFGGDLNTSSSQLSYQMISQDNTATLGEVASNLAFVECNLMPSVTEKVQYSCSHAYAHWNDTLGIYDTPTYTTANFDKSSIDHIFGLASSYANYRVERYCRVGDLFVHLVSDHCPLFIDVTLYPDA